MNEFKFQLLSVVLIVLLGTGVYWAFSSLESGVPQPEDRVVVAVEDPIETETPIETPEEEVVPEETPVETETKELSADEKSLRDALERLIDDNIYMKKGSHGTRVGTVQKFLNYYFETSKTVDNDYGPGTMADVKKFQEAEGLGADGLAGPNTYRAMIKVLEA